MPTNGEWGAAAHAPSFTHGAAMVQDRSKGKRRPPAAALLSPFQGVPLTVTICVWRFEDAPSALKAHAQGGDYTWLVFVPDAMRETYLPWLEWIDYDRKPEVHQLREGVVCLGRR
jgi:hypothetical protein